MNIFDRGHGEILDNDRQLARAMAVSRAEGRRGGSIRAAGDSPSRQSAGGTGGNRADFCRWSGG